MAFACWNGSSAGHPEHKATVSSFRVIPSLLVDGDRLVKGSRFGNYRDAGGLQSTVRAHDSQSADELIIIDINAAKSGGVMNLDMLARALRDCWTPVTVGGNVATVETAQRYMDAGADKILVNTAALDRPDLISELADRFGVQAVVLGIDISRDDTMTPRIFDHRTGIPVPDKSPLSWIREAVEAGAGEIRVCAVDREGMRSGFDIALLQQVLDLVSVPVIIEGGAGILNHIAEAAHAGASGAALGTTLVFSDNNIFKIKVFLKEAGIPVRM
jgi:cyclase